MREKKTLLVAQDDQPHSPKGLRGFTMGASYLFASLCVYHTFPDIKTLKWGYDKLRQGA